MIAVSLGLISSLLYGFADFSGGFAARGAHALRVSAIAAPASLAVELASIPVLGARWESGAIGWGAASGLASAAAFALLYATLAQGPMSILSPVTALISEALPVAMGVAWGERLHPPAMVGLPVSAVAVLLLGAARNADRRRPAARVLVLAAGAGTAIALQLIALKLAPSDSGVAPLVVGRSVSALLLLVAVAVRRGHMGALSPSLPLAIAAGTLDSLANLFFLYAVRHGPLAVVAVIVALYPAATVLLARVVLAERLSLAQAVGMAVAVLAVVLLALQ